MKPSNSQWKPYSAPFDPRILKHRVMVALLAAILMMLQTHNTSLWDWAEALLSAGLMAVGYDQTVYRIGKKTK